MIKSEYHISKMDCPSEENMIRMKIGDIREIKKLEFDLENRILKVIHTKENPEITAKLEELKLGSKKLESIVIEDNIQEENTKIQSKLLWIVLIINFAFFVIEMITGILSKSMGLVADSLDMSADTLVYGLSLWAVGAASIRKKRVARMSGYFQILLAVIGLVEVIRRFINFDEIPDFGIMIIVSASALIANAACLFILQKAKSNEIHIKASLIFTANDVIINIGVIVAGILVFYLKSKYPDLIIGSIVFLIVVRGAIRILKLAK